MSPRRRRLLGALAVLVTVAVIAVIARLGAGSSAPPLRQDEAGPVLLIPGYGGNTRSLEQLAIVLRADGHTAEVVTAVGDGTGDLRAQARNLARAAERAVAAGAPSVDVVGYSAGGVVARIWITELGGARIARRVITLGSPHHGTQVAAIGAAFTPSSCPTACRQLVPDSPLLGGLRPLPPGTRWVSLWTRNDDTVTPPASARLDGALNVELQSVCSALTLSHGGLPVDPLVQGIIEQALTPAGLTTAPAPSQCDQLRTTAG